MAAMDKPWLTAWTDDDGSGVTGTIWNKARISEMSDAFDGIGHGGQIFSNANSSMLVGYTHLVNLNQVDFGATYVAGASFLQIPANQGGLYLVTASVIWDSAHLGNRGIEVRKNGTAFLKVNDRIWNTGTLGLGQSLSGFSPAVTGDQFTLYGFSDAATNIIPGARFGIVRV